MKKIFLLISFFLIVCSLNAKDVILYNSAVSKDINGQVVEINENKIKILDEKNNRTIEIKVDKSTINKLKIGETIAIKTKEKNMPQCRCMAIRRRIKKLAEKRWKMHNHKGFSNNRMHRGGRR